MKRIFTLLFIIGQLTANVMAQSWEAIETSGQYIWGMGYGTTVAEADRNAMADLISKIATHVSSDFHQEEGETTINGKTDQASYVRSRVQTYSQATLTNAERLVLKNEPDAQVGRYMKKTEVHRIFESRQRKAIDMVQTALRAEETGKADDALRNLYWALALVRSLQYPNEAMFTDNNGQQTKKYSVMPGDVIFTPRSLYLPSMSISIFIYSKPFLRYKTAKRTEKTSAFAQMITTLFVPTALHLISSKMFLNCCV